MYCFCHTWPCILPQNLNARIIVSVVANCANLSFSSNIVLQRTIVAPKGVTAGFQRAQIQ